MELTFPLCPTRGKVGVLGFSKLYSIIRSSKDQLAIVSTLMASPKEIAKINILLQYLILQVVTVATSYIPKCASLSASIYTMKLLELLV